MTTQPEKSLMAGYWQDRQNLIYYRYVELIVRGVAAQAKSMIDVGSGDTSCIEWFNWIPRRETVDKRNPYSSKNVRGIKDDFFQFQPDTKYDLAICLQVLEHISNAGDFARKLFQIADAVLISVPFKWPAGGCKYHVHDPVDLEKLASWTQKEPDYHIVVSEPLMNSQIGKRLIAYYHPEGENFSLDTARKLSRQPVIQFPGHGTY